MKKVLILLVMLLGLAYADTYKLHLDTDGTEGTVEITAPDSVALKYTHDGTEVSPLAFRLDSIQVHAVDAANNVGAPAWLFIKIMPVNDNAPVVVSDTLVCLEGGSVNYTPTVTDSDN